MRFSGSNGGNGGRHAQPEVFVPKAFVKIAYTILMSITTRWPLYGIRQNGKEPGRRDAGRGASPAERHLPKDGWHDVSETKRQVRQG